MILFALLILVPLAEIWLLMQVSQATDWGTTLAIVIVTGLVGAALARRQGIECWARIRQQLSEGKQPAREMSDGLMILFAGAFLLTPGLITDVVGLLLLVPPVRSLLRGWVVARMVPPGASRVYSFVSRPRSDEIEAEYTVEREPQAAREVTSLENQEGTD